MPYSFTIVRSPYARMVSEFNWMALSDPAKAADIKAGRWSFTCGEFQDFVERRVDGLVGSALFRCLAQSALNEADYERCVAENPSAETINDSHALPQWFLAKNAERVFKYEQFASEVWPFLKRVGVVSRGQKTLEKINSAGGASAVASECWAFVSAPCSRSSCGCTRWISKTSGTRRRISGSTPPARARVWGGRRRRGPTPRR